MYNVAQDNVKTDLEESRGLASALVLSTIDSSATGKLFARSTPIISLNHGMLDISLNPLYDHTQVSFNTP
ncbi:MAG TPA: hypothetical protein PKA38_00490 [Candidatus Levybacteria bacterium]|nr:hypothetical protein [Candidatus Levybacteria bacterium]